MQPEQIHQVTEEASKGNWTGVFIALVPIAALLIERYFAHRRGSHLKAEKEEVGREKTELDKGNKVMLHVALKILEARRDAVEILESDYMQAFFQWAKENGPEENIDFSMLDPVEYLKKKHRFTSDEAAELARWETELNTKTRAARIASGEVGMDTMKDFAGNLSQTDISDLLRKSQGGK